MANNQYEKLLGWLDSLLDTEFHNMMSSLLPPELQNVLTQPLNSGSFLNDMNRWKYLDRVENYLIDNYSERFSESKPQRELFINQQDIMEIILSSHASSYHLLDAPAGYGKTALLKELLFQLKEKHCCAYLSVKKNEDFKNILLKLFIKFDFEEQPDYEKIGKLIANLGKLLKEKRRKDSKKGIVFLIDFEKLGKDLSSKCMKELLDFIRRLYRSLTTDKFFLSSSRSFRVIVAGRCLANLNEIKSSNLLFRAHKLHLFSYDILLDFAKTYLQNLDESEIKDISSHIMYLSGGHSGCMAALLEKYQEGCQPFDEFLDDYINDIQEITRKNITQVRYDIPDELKDIMDKLSPCRRFNPEFLRKLMEHKIIETDDEYDLSDELTNAYLIKRGKDGFLQDDITRRLLSIRLYQESKEEFLKISEIAIKIYSDTLSTSIRPDVIIIELLYQKLQLGYYKLESDTESERKSLADSFFSTLNDHLKKLIDKRDSREMIDLFSDTIENDWEFQFVLNYFLRMENYNDQPFNRLKQQINDFCKSL
ncbi:MAG: hypothetical protein GY795_35010 [Desulfobacterales bacterium]|nr:hypothetical protein [Desulfobacterales bacterium]